MVLFYLTLSGIGAALLSAVVWYAPNTPVALSLFEKRLVGSVFLFLCVLGISFCIRPGWLKKVLKKHTTTQTPQEMVLKRTRIGHHPDCVVFNHHRISIKQKSWCAGCVGLLIGCLLSGGLMILYLLDFFTFNGSLSRVLFFSGLVALFVVYIEILLGSRAAVIHIILNSMLIVGFFLITIGVMQLTAEVINGFFSLLLCILWLDTRIVFSSWRHSQLCSICPEACKTY